MKNLLLLLCLTISFSVIAESNFPDNRHVQVEGIGTVSAKPDMMKITFDITSIKDSSCAAGLEVEKNITTFLNGLSAFNITDDMITATSLSVDTDYAYTEDDEEMIVGYIAYRTLTVTLPQKDSLDDFMEFLLSIDVTEYSELEPISSEIKKYQALATKKAVEDAKAKAQVLAKAFGAKLGKVYSINTSLYDTDYDYFPAEEITYIVKTETSDDENKTQNKYLEATINYSSTISVIFDLKVR